MDKLDFLINYLLSERNDIGRIGIPENETDKFRLYRSLVNIRPAVKADEIGFVKKCECTIFRKIQPLPHQ